jgi:hypothetical protein
MYRDPRFSGRDDLPEYADETGSRAYRQHQAYERESARLERERVEISNREKMTRLRENIESGELDRVDAARRWYHGLAVGESHGDRELAQIEANAYELDPLEDGDPHARLAWLETHKTERRGNITGAALLAELAEMRQSFSPRFGGA